MKTLIYIVQILLFGVILLITSCKDTFLETIPKTEYSELAVWKDPAMAQSFINEMYIRLGDQLVPKPTSCFCDESHRRQWSNSLNFCSGNITPDNIRGWVGREQAAHWDWTQLYKSIRATNIFFENIENVNFAGNLDLKSRMIGEVHFCRAYYYFYLLRMYGGVPIITNVFGLGEDYMIPRDSFEDVAKLIVDELDKAASFLPEFQNAANAGRATKGAALALKSRVLLTVASDLYNTTIFPNYTNPELIGYTDKSAASRTARWQAAKDAAKAVMDMGIYNLFQGTNDSITLNFVDYFTSISNPVEDIFVRYIVGNLQIIRNSYGRCVSPVGWRGTGDNVPIGQMADSYEMRDGTKFNWNNPAHKANPYKNRDPRFYADILYEGAYWQPRKSDLAARDPLGCLKVGNYEKWDPVNNLMFLVGGLDGRTGNVSPFEASETNYYSRKYLNPHIYNAEVIQNITFRWIRYTEILFNYAEACIELRQDAEARTYLNKIRKRAGMPDITESGDALRQRYRNEKRVEMYLENQRFWDVHRWVIGPEAYTPVMKVEFYYPLLPDKTTSTVPKITVRELAEIKRKWIDKCYFFPIYRDEMNRDSKLIQNPNY